MPDQKISELTSVTSLSGGELLPLVQAGATRRATVGALGPALSNVPNAALSNSSVTVNGANIALGGSATVTAVNPNALTLGSGLTGTSYNGSTAVTATVDATAASTPNRIVSRDANGASAFDAVQIDGATSGTVTVRTAAAAGTWNLTLPTSPGTAGQSLTTDGTGTTSWQNVGVLVDNPVSPTMSAPYAVQTSDVNRRILVNTAGDGAVTFASTGSIPNGSRIGLAAFGTSTVTMQLPYDSLDLNLNSGVSAIVQQPDGRVIVAGFFTTILGTTRNRIARINTDGTLDTGFNPNVDNNAVTAVALQSDGRILIGGSFTSIGGTTRNRMARLNTDGTLDTGFNPNVGTTSVNAIAVQSDGRIVIGGDFTQVGASSRNRLARLNADGTVDTGFNISVDSTVFGIALQSDQRIVIAGAFLTVGGTAMSRVARINTNGTLDTGYNPPTLNQVNAIAIQSDDRVIVGGNNLAPRRLTTTGASDGTWSCTATHSSALEFRAIAIQPDGRVLLAGQFDTVNGTARANFARVTTTGALDTSIEATLNGAGNAVARLSDGRIFVGGSFTTVNGTTRNRAVRLFESIDTINAPYASPLTVPRYGNLVLEKTAAGTWVIVESNCS